MLSALFDLMELNPEEKGVNSQCSLGTPLLMPIIYTTVGKRTAGNWI